MLIGAMFKRAARMTAMIQRNGPSSRSVAHDDLIQPMGPFHDSSKAGVRRNEGAKRATFTIIAGLVAF
jgi:hypothetical protein